MGACLDGEIMKFKVVHGTNPTMFESGVQLGHALACQLQIQLSVLFV